MKNVRLLYSSRRGRKDRGSENEGHERVLFEDRLKAIAEKWSRISKGETGVDYRYTFFDTGSNVSSQAIADQEMGTLEYMTYEHRRIKHDDLLEAIGPEDDRANTVVYICGLPTMTDEFVEFLKRQPGLDEKRVLCEKWW